jgi:tetratricopeptide (TPR) repeat protein
MELRTDLKQRLRTARSWPGLIEELEREVEKIEPKDTRAQRLFELGEICEELFLRKDRAMVHYQAAFKLSPQDARALERARRIYREMGNLDMVATLLGLELKVAPTPQQKAEIQGQLGIALLDLGRRDQALPNLEEAAEARPDDHDIADALAAANYDKDDWLGEAERLTKQAEKSASGLAARIYLRIARIYRMEVPADPAYVDTLKKVVANEPQHEQANFLLEGALGTAQKWDEIVQLHDKRAYAFADEKDQANLYRRFASVWALRFKDLERAAGFYRKALQAYYGDGAREGAAFPGHLAAFGFLREIEGGKGEWQRLLQLADLGLGAGKALSQDELAILATQAGVISWREMKDPDRAKPYFDRVQQLAPENEELRAFLSSQPTNGSNGSHKSEAAPEAPAPAAAAPAAPVPQAADSHREAPHSERVENIDDAVRAGMDAAKQAEAAGPDKGIDAWKKLTQANPTVRAVRREYARVLRAAERWNALIELHKEEVEKLTDTSPDEKVTLLHEMVGIYRDRLKLDVMVLNSYNAILALKPGDAGALDALVAQYEHMKRWPDLISTLQKKAASTNDVGDQVQTYLRVASLFQEKFSNVAEAIKAFEKVLELDGGNATAIAYLKTNYEKRRDWEKLIGVHQREIDQIADAALRSQKFVEIAKLASEKLKKPAISIELWQKVADADPNHPEALSELEKLYEREKLWDKLADNCERQVALFTDKAKKVAMLQKLGILFTDKVVDNDRATTAWRALLQVEPENKRAQDALKKLYLAAKNFDELEKFYSAQNKYDEYIRVLERQAETEDDATKVVLHLRIAELYRDRLQKADRAMRAYEKVLTLDAQNLPAAEALIPLYEAHKDPKKLAQALEIQLHHTQDPSSRKDRMQRLAQLAETAIKDKPVAFGWYLKAFAEDPDLAWARSETERLAAETGGQQELVTAYEAAYKGDSARVAGREALPLMAVVARVYENDLAEADKALSTNAAILQLDETNADAILALERLYLKTERYQELLDIYGKKLTLEMEPAKQKEIRYKVASIYENEVKDDKKAIEAYRAILDDHGAELAAYRALDRIYSAGQQWKELCGVLPRELDLVPPEDIAQTVELKFRLGTLKEQHLDDPKGAIGEFREILSLDAGHQGARQALERRLGDADHQLDVAAILEPIYEKTEEWPRLIEVHEIQLAREKKSPQRLSLLLRIGELQATKIGDGEKAFDAYGRAFKEDASSTVARGELERLAEINESFPQLVGLYEGALPPEGPVADPALQRELLLKIADAYDSRLEKAEKAVEYYRKAQSIDPDDAGALEALEKLYTKNEKWPELLEVYRKKVELSSEPAEREAIYFRMAFIWEEMLQNIEEAIGTYKEVLSQDSANQKALKALDRLYLDRKRWHELADNLTRQLQLTDDKRDTIELSVRLASLREKEIGEVAAAVDTYRQVLELDPGNDAALTALERLVKLPEHELQVATILEPIYKTRDDSQKLIDVTEILVKHAMDPARKIELLHRIGEIYDLSTESQLAFSTYDRALKEDPGLEETRTRLERLARELGRWKDLVYLYEAAQAQVGASTGDVELQVLLLTRVAQIEESQLEDTDAAATAYHKVLKVSPRELPAVDSLLQLYTRTDASTKLVEVVLQKAEIVETPVDKKDQLFRAAQIYEEILENADRAIDVYRQILSVDENDRHAIDALERLYIRLERWEPLKDIYAKKAELATVPEDKKQMLFVLGQVYDRELKDTTRAIEVYQSILDIDAEEQSAIQALDRLYLAAERWYDLLQILEREVELAGSTAESVSLKYRVGQLWEHKLKDLGRAVEAYRDLLSYDGGHEPTLAALDGIVHGDHEPVTAAAVLEPIYEAAGDWERLIDVLEVTVKHAEDPLRRVELLHRIADYQERCMENATAAFKAYGRALHEDSTNDLTIKQLERLADVVRGWAELAGLYEAELTRIQEPLRQVEMGLRVARVYEQELTQADKAIATFRRVLDVDGENRDAILALDRLYQQGEAWRELADVLRREIRLGGADSEVIALQFRLGQLFEQNLQDIDAALEVYREILTSDSNHSPTVSALELLFAEGQRQIEIASVLEPLYRVGEQWEKLVKINEVQLGKIEQADERLQMIQRIAEVYEHRLVDQASAFVWWAQGLREQPRSELAGEEVERLAKATHGWDELAQVCRTIIEEQKEPEVLRLVHLRLARILEEELHDVSQAETAFLQVLSIDANAIDALVALDRIYTQGQMWAELADILRRRIANTTDTDGIIELYFRLGRVNEDALERPDEAVGAYNAILEADSRNGRALESLEAVYFRREQWPELFSVYEKMVDIAPGDEAMADCYARMAKISSDGLGQRERAAELWGRVLDLRGEDPIALGELGRLYEQAGQWRELVDVLERQLRIDPEPSAQIPIYLRLGRIWDDQLKKERSAVDCYQQALDLDAGQTAASEEALRALAAIYRRSQAWDELVSALQRLVEVAIQTGAADLVELYAELGTIEGETLMRPHEAIEAWRHVLELEPSDFRALGALEQLFTQEARWEECIQILEQKARVLDDDKQRVEVLLQAASVWEDKIGDRDRAGQVYERILQVDAQNLTASLQLEQVYRAQHAWDKLIELLLARTEFTSDPAGRVQIFQAMAEIYEKEIGDQEGAFTVLQAAFRENYADQAVSGEIERLASATNKWTELLSDYTQVVQEIQDPATAADLWVKIGKWYGEHLGHLDYAIASEQQALALVPDHLEALEALAQFFRKTSKWNELADTLERHAGLEQEADKKTALYTALAELWEGPLGDDNRAIDAHQQALQSTPANVPSMDALVRLYGRAQQWPELIDILTSKAGVIDETNEIVSIRHQVGQLYEERLGDGARAISSYKEILTVDPQNLDALKALERLYEKTGQMEAYLDVLEQQLDVSGDNEERISLYERMAAAWEEQFRKPERAWEALEKILLIDDRHTPTLETLERLYRQERRASELVETLRRHINAVSDPTARIELYAQMGQVYEEDLKDPDRAVEAFNDILSFDSDNTHALAALFRLYEKISDWDRAIDSAQRLAELTDDVPTRVDLCHRLGKIYEERLNDVETAELRYMDALSLDGGYVPTMQALTTMYDRRGDWLKAAQMRVRTEAQTVNPLEKVKLLFEAGRIFEDKLDREMDAADLYASVLELDPEHVDAGEPLADIYFRDEKWAPLEPILDMLVRKIDKKDSKDLNQLYFRLARTADELNNPDKAIKYYKLAYDLDSTHLPTLLGRASLLYKMEDWEGAFKIYQTILVHHRDSQKESEIVDIFYRLGNIKLKQGERKKALNMFEKALELEATHRPTLQSVVDLQTQGGDFEAVIHAKRALVSIADEPERLKLLDEIGDIYSQKLNNPQKAITAYLEAVELRGDNHVILHKVLDLYSSTTQWKKAVEIIERIANLEKEPARKGKYFHAAARIVRDEVKSLDDAVEYFNQALDLFFANPDRLSEENVKEYLKAFESIDKICTNKKDWKAQERQYKRMFKRIAGATDAAQWNANTLKVALLHALGEIYRSRLKEHRNAIDAFEMATKLDPANTQRREILAELYILGGPDYAQRAVAEHMTLIRRDAFRVDSYKALRKIYMETNQYDKAWCLCQALVFLQRADAEETQFFEQYRQKGFVRAKARLTDEMWAKNVFHQEEDRYVGAVFAAVWQGVALLKSGEHKQFGLKRKEKRDLQTDQALFSKVFNYVTQVLNLQQPEVYFRPEQQGGMQLANTREKQQLIPSLIIGAELLQGRGDKELAFPIAAFITKLRPEHYLRLTIPTNTELGIAFLAAIKLVQPQFPVPANQAPTVDQYLGVLRTSVPPQWHEQLAIVVKKFIESKGEINLQKWSTAVDLTSHRAGFIIANDLTLSARFIQMEPATVGGLSAKDKIKELVLYSISEEYFELRQHLGLVIG